MSFLPFRKTAALLLALCLSSGSSLAWAQNFNVGLDKFDKQDYAGALREWQPLANRGDADAQFNLGVMYAEGAGIKQDYAQAVAWYRKAADQGDAHAQTNLGAMYEAGEGVKQDYAQAAAWYRKAADRGDADAQFSLGVMHETGRGVKRDDARALAWYTKAAENFHGKAREAQERLQSRNTGADKLGNLRQLIATSASMSAKERQEWLTLLPKMNAQQIAKLTEVLETEKRKLEELDRKYQQDIKALNEKYAK